MNFIIALLDFIIPRYCLVCGRKLLVKEKHLCMHCLADLPLTYFWERTHNPMADTFNEKIQKVIEAEEDFSENFSQEFQESPLIDAPKDCYQYIPYSYATALFFYTNDSNYFKITPAIKYKGQLKAGEYFGRMLGTKLKEGWGKDIDVVIPVPLHWKRMRNRGYNQAEIIAQGFAKAHGAVLCLDLLVRSKYTESQTKLAGEEKLKNVQNAFSINKKSRIVTENNILHIVLIDDVFTSGSTMAACYFTLRQHFPPTVRISVATLGFVGD